MGYRLQSVRKRREGVTHPDAVALVPDEFHGEWNYKLEPRRS